MPLAYYAIYQGSDDALCLGTDHGLVCLRGGQWSRLGTELYRAEVRCITEAADGVLWIGMRGGDLAPYRDGKVTQFRRGQGLPSDYV